MTNVQMIGSRTPSSPGFLRALVPALREHSCKHVDQRTLRDPYPDITDADQFTLRLHRLPSIDHRQFPAAATPDRLETRADRSTPPYPGLRPRAN